MIKRIILMILACFIMVNETYALDAESMANDGYLLLKSGKVDEAIVKLSGILKTSPDDPYAALYLGLAYLEKDDVSKTISLWQDYKNKKNPVLEKEIAKQLTILQIAESHKDAEEALANEGKLSTLKSAKNTIAVCYFNDLSSDKSLSAFKKGLAAMVITDLSKVGELKVLERVRMQALIEEMNLSESGLVDTKTAIRLGRLLGTENIVVGNLTLGSIKTVMSLASVSGGTVSDSRTFTVEKKKFYDLPKMIVEGVSEILGIKLSKETIAAISKANTENYEAFIDFSNGLNFLDEGRWDKAKTLFEKAAKTDASFGLSANKAVSCPDSFGLKISDIKNGANINQTIKLIERDINKILEDKASKNMTGLEVKKYDKEKVIAPDSPDKDDLRTELFEKEKEMTIKENIDFQREKTAESARLIDKETPKFPGTP